MDSLFPGFLGKPVWSWPIFLAVGLGFLVFDPGIQYRTSHAIGLRKSLLLSTVYLAVSAMMHRFMHLKTRCRRFSTLSVVK